ncbi:MAG TPA: NUDIX hydrolase [Candidatus Paceibacterota bacterium]
MENRPKVGVGVVIRKDGKVLVGKRLSAHGNGTWSPPGGHLEFGESWEACARREALEECGVSIKNVHFGAACNNVYPEENKHYVTINMVADWESGEPTILEPDKCAEWRWCDWNDLPQPLLPPIQDLVSTGFDPFN